MFSEIGASHHRAHFHAYYQEHTVVLGIEPVEVISGSLPRRQQRLVEAWAELHEDELLADWNRLIERRAAVRIAPLQ